MANKRGENMSEIYISKLENILRDILDCLDPETGEVVENEETVMDLMVEAEEILYEGDSEDYEGEDE